MKKGNLIKRKGQEEMIGFVLIIVIVMIIGLVFLSFKGDEKGEGDIGSYEVNSFIQSIEQYTTKCTISSPSDFRKYNQLVKDCSQSKSCYDGKDTCEVLEEETRGIMKASWNSNDRGGLKGYSIVITDDDKVLLNESEGNITRNYIGPTKEFKSDLKIDLRIYQ